VYFADLKPAKISSEFPADLESDEHTAGGTATTAEITNTGKGRCCGAGTRACYAAIFRTQVQS